MFIKYEAEVSSRVNGGEWGVVDFCKLFTETDQQKSVPIVRLKVRSTDAWRARRARAYNGGLGAEPPAGSRGRAPGQWVRGAKPP